MFNWLWHILHGGNGAKGPNENIHTIFRLLFVKGIKTIKTIFLSLYNTVFSDNVQHKFHIQVCGLELTYHVNLRWRNMNVFATQKWDFLHQVQQYLTGRLISTLTNYSPKLYQQVKPQSASLPANNGYVFQTSKLQGRVFSFTAGSDDKTVICNQYFFIPEVITRRLLRWWWASVKENGLVPSKAVQFRLNKGPRSD